MFSARCGKHSFWRLSRINYMCRALILMTDYTTSYGDVFLNEWMTWHLFIQMVNIDHKGLGRYKRYDLNKDLMGRGYVAPSIVRLVVAKLMRGRVSWGQFCSNFERILGQKEFDWHHYRGQRTKKDRIQNQDKQADMKYNLQNKILKIGKRKRMNGRGWASFIPMPDISRVSPAAAP